MNKNNKIIIGVVVALVLLTGVILYVMNNKSSETTKKTENVLDNEPTVAPVDSSVVVDFKEGAKSGEAILSIKNAPQGTKSIEYEVSYDAVSTNPDEGNGGSIQQGLAGECKKTGSDWTCGEPTPEGGRKLVFGTCSSGVCRYHKITSQIDVRLMFSGGYGQRVFEKKYSL